MNKLRNKPTVMKPTVLMRRWMVTGAPVTLGDLDKTRKYRNIPVEFDGIRFDSQREAKRYVELRLLEKAGEIVSLLTHPSYPLHVNGVKVCSYRADFCYFDKAGNRVVEDAKGVRTPVYRLKTKLMKAILGIEVREI